MNSTTKALAHNAAIGAIAILTGAAVMALAVAILAGDAEGHEALPTAAQPLGWKYPWACCASLDCRPTTAGEVTEGRDGYTIQSTGEIVAYLDKRIKDSPDGVIHWCAHQAGADAGHTICLFVPPKGF